MSRRLRLPLPLVAIALLGLIALLATLQYIWLGRISDAERDRLRTTLNKGALEFAQDFDRELARAFILFQPDMVNWTEQSPAAERFAMRYDQWQGSARFPRLLKDFYLFVEDERGVSELRQFNPGTRQFERADWPPSMADWRERVILQSDIKDVAPGQKMFVRMMPSRIWESVPALVVPMPLMFLSEASMNSGAPRTGPKGDEVEALRKMHASTIYSILTIDQEFVTRELLPSLAERHFAITDTGTDFRVAVVSRAKDRVVFQSTPSFSPTSDTRADATADLFQVRTQDFSTLAAEVRRFVTFSTSLHGPAAGAVVDNFTVADKRPLSVVIQGSPAAGPRGATTTRVATTTPSHWKLIVSHPSGSLEAAVNAARRRNLLVSFSILGVLGASMGLLVLATRRAQRLATQQMEFVAGVSHELRTPLAVIRSAAENLADGVVHDDAQIRRYGELMRNEGRRLTEMVEQILEFAGIQSGQRGFALRPVAIEPLLRDIVSSSAALIEEAGLRVEFNFPPRLPPVLGDEPALRRVFQNLIDNAVKYGAGGGWIGISAQQTGSVVKVTIADRGIGINAADQERIFEPFYRAADVVSAQTQGAGLGLSLVQRIVLAHSGRVSVKSAPKAGSEFIVELPAAGEEPLGERAEAAQSAASAS